MLEAMREAGRGRSRASRKRAPFARASMGARQASSVQDRRGSTLTRRHACRKQADHHLAMASGDTSDSRSSVTWRHDSRASFGDRCARCGSYRLDAIKACARRHLNASAKSAVIPPLPLIANDLVCAPLGLTSLRDTSLSETGLAKRNAPDCRLTAIRPAMRLTPPWMSVVRAHWGLSRTGFEAMDPADVEIHPIQSPLPVAG